MLRRMKRLVRRGEQKTVVCRKNANGQSCTAAHSLSVSLSLTVLIVFLIKNDKT